MTDIQEAIEAYHVEHTIERRREEAKIAEVKWMAAFMGATVRSGLPEAYITRNQVRAKEWSPNQTLASINNGRTSKYVEMIANGWNDAAIARHYKISIPAVHKHCQRLGLTVVRSERVLSQMEKKKICDARRREVMTNPNLTVDEMAVALGVTRPVVRAQSRMLGIELPGAGPKKYQQRT